MMDTANNEGSNCGRHLVSSLGVLLATVLGLCLIPSVFASCIAIATKHIQQLTFPFVCSSISYLSVMVGAVYMLIRRMPNTRPGRLLSEVLILGFVWKLLLIFLHLNYQQTADTLYFRDFVVQMVDGGINQENMADLSGIWDYQLWFSRAFPFMAAARALFGGHDMLVVSIMNATIMTVILWLSYVIARRVFGVRVALMASTLLALSPVHSWLVLDYSHQPQGVLWLCVGIALSLCVAGSTNRRWVSAGASAALGITLFLICLQRGLDIMLCVLLTLLWLFCLVAGPARDWFRVTMALLVLPMMIYLPSAHRFQAFMDYYNAEKLGSGLVSIIAHGWNHQTGGEFYGPYNQIDRASPFDQKAAEMNRIIVSTFTHEPLRTAGVLAVVKVAKFFLIGSASGVEERLRVSGYESSAECFRGMRVAYTLPAVFLAMLGAFSLVKCRRLSVIATYLVSVPVLACGLFALLGQTSPRYSLYVQPVLAIIGALPLVYRPGDSQFVSQRLFVLRIVGWTASLLLMYSSMVGVGVWALKSLGAAYCYQDIRASRVSTSLNELFAKPEATFRSSLEQVVWFPPGNVAPGDWVECQLDVGSKKQMVGLSMFLWNMTDVEESRMFRCNLMTGSRNLEQFRLDAVGSIRRCAYAVDLAETDVPFRLRVTYTGEQAFSTKTTPVGFRWGYLYVERAKDPHDH